MKWCVVGFLLFMVMAIWPVSLSGQTFVWTQTSAPNSSWIGIASSADGTKLAACFGYAGGGVYISTNTGSIWTKVNSPSVPNPWQNYAAMSCIASSADGRKLVIGSSNTGYSTTNSGYVYASTDAGSTWTQANISGAWCWEDWSSIASTSNGMTVFATGYYNIFASTNYGVTWQFCDPSPNPPNPRGHWKTVVCSSDGMKLLATDLIQLFTSTNAGANWSLTSAPSNQWSAIASSADGTKLVACNDYSIGRIYTSTNSGLNWMPTSAPSNTFWSAVTSSTDGTKLAACSYSGNIYFSTNSGSTWTSNSFPTYVKGMATSADGTKLFAVFYGGGISIGQLVVPAQNYSANFNGSGVNLQFTGAPSCPYVLFATTNLSPSVFWQPVVTNSTDASGRWSFTDTNWSQYEQRFYTASQ